jgi:uncharacterized protein YegP (UPF0339 family)
MQFVIYKDSAGQYRWRYVASNGKTIADSGEGYYNKADCQAGIDLVKAHAATAPVKDTTTTASTGTYAR